MTQKELQKKITGTDVARAAGCSQATVSKVINNSPDVSEFLRGKVLEQARRLGYFAKSNRLRRLAVILPAPWRFRLDGYVAQLLNAVIYVLHRHAVRMEIVLEDDLNALTSRTIDGGISISWEPDLTARWFDHFQLPLVRINSNPALYRQEHLLAHVNMDSAKSMALLLDKFYQLGHRRIFLLAPDAMEIEQCRTRYQGFCDYLRSRRVQHPEQNCIFGMRDNSFDKNLALLKQAVSNGATALIAVDEGAARNALSLIEKLKLNVPKRISVVSWEQKDILPYCAPSVTGMAMDYTQLAEAAVDLLSTLCRGEKVSDVYFPFRMIERESVGPVYKRKTRGKLPERILRILARGPITRTSLAAELDMPPYSGYFSRTILSLLNSKKIVYCPQTSSGRNRLLTLASPNGMAGDGDWL